MKAMILAAGLGTRLRPRTDVTPKPLVKVADKTLIDYAFDLVRGADVSDVVVNCHHLADQIEAHVGAISDLNIDISDERGQLLETGGGVQKALPLLGVSPFAVLNSDVIVRDPEQRALKDLSDRWDPAEMDVLLLMMPVDQAVGYDGDGDFHMADDGRLTRRQAGETAPYLFAGIQIVNPTLFEGVRVGRFSMNVIFDKALANGRLFGLQYHGQWLHVGTEQALEEAEQIIRST